MPRQNHEPKPFLKEIINAALAAEGVDSDDAVMALGKFGERGVVFYPYTAEGCADCKVGFSLVAKGVNTSHTNLSRAQAASIVALLIDEYDFEVFEEEVPVTITQTRVASR